MKRFLFLLVALFIMQTFFLIAEDNRIWKIKTHYHYNVEFSPNSYLILSHGQHGGNEGRRGVIIFNTNGDTIQQFYNSKGLKFRNNQGIWDAHFSEDGRFLVVIWEHDIENLARGMLEIYETENWTSIKKIDIEGDAFSLLASKVLISPNNQNVVAVTTNGFYFYDFISGQLINHIQNYGQSLDSYPYMAVYSKNGSHIYFTSTDGRLRFLNTQTYEVDYSYNAGYGNLTISKDGSMIAFKTGLTGKSVQVMDIEAKEIVQTIPGFATGVSGLAFSIDGKYLGVAFQNQAILNIYNINSGEIVKNLLGSSYGTLSYSYDDKYIITDVGSLLILLPNTITSVSDKEVDLARVIYPNPTNNSVNIRFNLKVPGYTKISIFDNTGREAKIVFQGPLDRGEQNISTDVGKLQSGNYVIKVSSPGTEISFKLIINR